MSIELESEERALGEWPRRLLYVPDMISYPWQPGTTYNGIKKPRYNAITYTWGRWRLKEGERSDVEALEMDIDGDDWPIPRVASEHFTVEQFEDAIASATFCPNTGGEEVDFIWLDIACISQRDDPRSAAEIGRQAAIFRGARCVFVWFTTVSELELKAIVDDMWWIESEQPSDYHKRHEQAHRGIIRLLSDPWFSSLWTLQEAFLRQDAYLLSSDPSLIERSEAGNVCDLSSILFPCAHWRWYRDRIESGLTDSQITEFEEVTNMIKGRGLMALSSQHEISTYIAAQSRTASRENDRIYGLQQVFRLRLGKTALKPTSDVFDIADLENQFGEALLLQHPVHSQMHVFARYVPVHDRWRIRWCSRELRDDAFRLPAMFDERLPQIVGNPPAFWVREREADNPADASSVVVEDITTEESIWSSRQNALVIHCALSIGPATHQPRPVTWSGLMCPFSKLWKLSDRIYTNVHLVERKEAIDQDLFDESEPMPTFPLFVDLDTLDDLLNVPGAGQTSKELADFLGQKFAEHELQVLLLASCWPAYTQEGFKHGMFGLLLVEQQTQWARIGVCQWSCEAGWEPKRLELTREEMGLLSAQGTQWVQNNGILGFASG